MTVLRETKQYPNPHPNPEDLNLYSTLPKQEKSEIIKAVPRALERLYMNKIREFYGIVNGSKFPSITLACIQADLLKQHWKD